MRGSGEFEVKGSKDTQGRTGEGAGQGCVFSWIPSASLIPCGALGHEWHGKVVPPKSNKAELLYPQIIKSLTK